MKCHRLGVAVVCGALALAAPAGGQPKASPLDRLRPAAIPEAERKFLSVPGLVGLVQPHRRAVAALAFSADGSLLASSSWDNTVRLIRFGKDAPDLGPTLDAGPSGVALSPDGKLLACGSADAGARLWDVGRDPPALLSRLAGHAHRPFAVALSPDGKLLATGCLQPVLRLWKLDDPRDPEAWAVLANEKSPSLGVSSFAFAGDGKYLAAGNHLGKQTLRLWNVAGSYLDEMPAPSVKARLVAASRSRLAFSGDDGGIEVRELPALKPGRALAGHPPRGGVGVRAIAFAPSCDVLASAGADRRLILWDAATGAKSREWQLRDEPRALAFAPDGRYLAVGNDDGSLYVLRLDD